MELENNEGLISHDTPKKNKIPQYDDSIGMIAQLKFDLSKILSLICVKEI